jgi:hypothetical protein
MTLGHKAVTDVVNHYDYHATLMYLFGLSPEQLSIVRPVVCKSLAALPSQGLPRLTTSAIKRFASSTVNSRTSRSFCRLVDPRNSSTRDGARLRAAAISRSTASLALPLSGGSVTASLMRSPCMPRICSRRDFGCTCTRITAPFAVGRMALLRSGNDSSALSLGSDTLPGVPQASHDAFKIVTVREVNHDLSGIVLLLTNVNLRSEMASQKILQTQNVIGRVRRRIAFC